MPYQFHHWDYTWMMPLSESLWDCQHCGAEVSQFATHGLSCKKSVGHHHTIRLSTTSYTDHYVPSGLEPSGLYRLDGKWPDGVSIVPWKCGQLPVWDATCPGHFTPRSKLEKLLNRQ